MMSPKSVGRLVGAMLFVQLAGLIVPFILLDPAITPAFLQNAAGRGPSVRTAVLLLLANGLFTTAIAIVMFSVLRERHQATALLLLAVSILWLVLQAVDNVFLLSMLSLSEQYHGGSTGDPSYLRTLGQVVRGMRGWAHYTALLAVEGWFLAFYAALLRSRLAPPPLAVLGIVMAVIHAAGVTAPMFLSYRGNFALAPSLGLSHLALGAWLAVKGFRVDHRQADAGS